MNIKIAIQSHTINKKLRLFRQFSHFLKRQYNINFHLCVDTMMKRTIYTFLPILLLVFAVSCEKTEAPNCQSDTFWADIRLDGTDYNTLSPCADWEVVVDSTTQSVDTDVTLGFRFSRVSTAFHLQNGDTTAGSLRFDLFFFAPESLIETSINGTDTSRTITPANICAILDSNYHRLGNSLQDTVSVVTNIIFSTNANYSYESYLLVSNWQIGGYGFQPLEIEGVTNGQCFTRFEMNALLTDTLATDTIQLSGRIRVPFK